MYSENTVKNVIKYKMKYDTTKECLFFMGGIICYTVTSFIFKDYVP